MEEQLPVTLCVSTRNAAGQLSSCLDSAAAWVREIVVVDMQSDDGTVALAESYGAKVISVPQAGFAEPARQLGIDAATQPWVLVLDADERAGDGLRAFVASTVLRDDVSGVFLPRRNWLFGRWIRHTGYWPDPQLRLFRAGCTRWPPNVHSWAVVDGPVEYAPVNPSLAIVHHNYDTVAEWIERNHGYTDMEVDLALADGQRPSMRRLLIRPLTWFVYRYVRRQGFRDGWHGLVISALIAINAAHVEIKLWERKRDSATVE